MGLAADETTPTVPESVTKSEVSFEESGPLLRVSTENFDADTGFGTSSGYALSDPAEISQYLAEHDPLSVKWFEDAYQRWEARQSPSLTSYDIEHPLGMPSNSPTIGPSSPMMRADRVDRPGMPQAVESSPQQPRSPEHRSEQAAKEPQQPPPPDLGYCSVPRNINESKNMERQDALRRELNRVDPAGNSNANLENRMQQLPKDKRAQVDDFLVREWIRAEEERRSTVVIGRHGRVWTRGEEERDKAHEVLQQGLDEAAAAAGSLGGALLMSAGSAAGVTDHQTLMNLAEMGSALENAKQSKAAGGGKQARPQASARRPPRKSNGGSKGVKGKGAAKSPRTGIKNEPPIRLNLEATKGLKLTKAEVKLVERVAEIFREEMTTRKNMKNQRLASQEAHKATQQRVIKEFGDAVVGHVYQDGILEPGTGASAPGHKRGDIQAFRILGDGLLIELKRTAFVRLDNTLVTKGMEALEPGQASQTDAFEVVHHVQGVPVIVVNGKGEMFSTARMYDEQTGGGWMQVGGPGG